MQQNISNDLHWRVGLQVIILFVYFYVFQFFCNEKISLLYWRVRGVEEVILKSKVSKGRMQSKMKKIGFYNGKGRKLPFALSRFFWLL